LKAAGIEGSSEGAWKWEMGNGKWATEDGKRAKKKAGQGKMQRQSEVFNYIKSAAQSYRHAQLTIYLFAH